MKKLIIFGGILIVTSILLYSCDKNKELENKPDDLFASFDRKAMLTNQVDNVIIPSFIKFSEQLVLLQTSVNEFSNAPDELNLLNLQNKWKEVYATMKQCEMYQFGVIEQNFLWAKIDFWPVRPNDVNDFLVQSESFTTEVLSSKGATVKGLPVLEYLIFDPINGNSKILDDFTTHVDKAKRKEYLNGLAENISTIAESFLTQWQSTYRNTYINNDAQGITGSINSTVNNMIATINYIKDNKIGKPFGKKDGILYPNEVEALQSKLSLNAIENNIVGFENLLLGKNINGTDGLGYDDFLDHLGAKFQDGTMSEKIKNQINDFEIKISLIETPLQQAIITDPEKVDALYLSLKQLLVLVQVDMVNNLGVTLTFTDNDGD
jgi:uncharacterized protein